MRFLVLSGILLLLSPVVTAQSGDLVKLIYAEKFSGTVINGEAVRIFEGNVHVERDGVNLYCNRMTEFTSQNVVHAVGNVKIIDGNETLTSDFGKYYPETRFTEVTRNVRLVSGSNTLTSESGQFSFLTNKAKFWKNTRMVDSTGTIILADTLFYDRQTRQSRLVGGVSIESPADRTLILGSEADHDARTLQSAITGRPLFIQWPEDATGDTLFISGTRLFADRRDSVNQFKAMGKARFLQGNLAADSDTMLIYRSTGLIDLRRNPQVWFENNQVTADTIHILTNGNELREMRCFGTGFSASVYDSVNGKFNQMKGQSLIYRFMERKIWQIEVNGTAESIYHLDDQGQPSGANEISGDRLLIFFSAGEVDRIRVTGGVEGKLLPEKQIVTDPVRLRGFSWNADRRPTRQEFYRTRVHE
ncbi:MAG: hypothetical protein HUU10_04055 [Bacteroidetes bacterium]|nr:hypothetical protein [Bacteroidota bacterium]